LADTVGFRQVSTNEESIKDPALATRTGEAETVYKRILVPLDGSKLAERVLPYAHAVAEATGVGVQLLRVFNPAPLAMADAGIGRYLNQIEAGLREESLEYLNSVRPSLAGFNTPVSCEVLLGHAASCIIAEADKTAGTLIAMSTHGRSGVSRWLLGSVTDKVLHATVSPLLIVRSRDEGKEPAEVHLKTVIVPLDGSPLAEQVLPYLTPLAKALELKVVLVRVIPPEGLHYGYRDYPVRYSEDFAPEEETEKHATDYLHRISDKLQEGGLGSAEECVLRGNPAEAIVDLAQATPDNLVAMTTHGRSGLGRWVLGSLTDRVVRHSGDPVLVVRAMAHPTAG
jgi:nucleotide-binding universal stress UspA family protein